MIKRLFLMLTAVSLLLLPRVSFGQTIDLKTGSSFAIFTGAGQIGNTGATTINGDLGAFVGAYPEPHPTVNGETHLADAVSAQAATDICAAYGQLQATQCTGPVLSTTLGSGQTLTPGVYCFGAATVIDGNLILDAQGDPNAVFIIKIDGALATTSGSTITLINGANSCNVFFGVTGAVSLGTNSSFLGTILGQGAISLASGATLTGRALTCVGAINLYNNTVTNPCTTSPPTCPLTLAAVSVCLNGNATVTATLTGTLVGTPSFAISGNNIDNVTGLTTGIFTDVPNGSYTITATVGTCTYTTTVAVNCIIPCPTITVTPSAGAIQCFGSTTAITVNASGGKAPYLYSINGSDNFQTSNLFNLVKAGSYTINVKDFNGCTGVSAALVITQPKQITATVSAGPCLSGKSKLTVHATGGTGTLQYSLNGGNSYQRSNVFTVISSGSYTVLVKDASNCTIQRTSLVVVNCDCATVQPPPQCVVSSAIITNVKYYVGNNTYTPTSSTYASVLQKAVVQGKKVRVCFTVPASAGYKTYSLISYQAPAATFIKAKADLQKVFDFETITVGPGGGDVCLEINVPNCYFQVDFIKGCIIEKLGPADTNPNNFYSNQNRLYGDAEGGTHSCTSSTTSMQESNGLREQDSQTTNGLTAFPTPFTDRATIAFTLNKAENYRVELYDMQGRLVKQLWSGVAKAGTPNQVYVEGNSLGEGVYLVKLITATASQTTKLILIK